MKPLRRYRNVEPAMWDSADFKALSPPEKPTAQFLWLYLLTGPATGPIPGLFVFSVAETAERFRWPLKGTWQAFGELLAKKRSGPPMAIYDESSRLLWLPRAITPDRNLPPNPNVVKSWRRPWAELPECELKGRAASVLDTILETLGEGFLKPFRELSASTPRHGSAIQVQEQDQVLTKSKNLDLGVSSHEDLTGHEAPDEARPSGVVGIGRDGLRVVAGGSR